MCTVPPRIGRGKIWSWAAMFKWKEYLAALHPPPSSCTLFAPADINVHVCRRGNDDIVVDPLCKRQQLWIFIKDSSFGSDKKDSTIGQCWAPGSLVRYSDVTYLGNGTTDHFFVTEVQNNGPIR